MDTNPLAAELDILMARAGVSIPPERRERLLASFADLREQVALLRVTPAGAALAATDEPAAIFQAIPRGERTA